MITVLCAVSFFGLGGCKGVLGERTVGKDVKIEDVTDFYYTYDASTNPPRYQRYRFTASDGKYTFYHEKREGDHWPLTEDDITVSGTAELTEEEWNTFFSYISGGTVEPRKEHLESGNAGPWLFLYWKNDRSKIQEYSFASYTVQRMFEEFCEKLRDNK